MRRIRRDATKEDFIAAMCDSKDGFFGEIARLLLFAALLGWSRGKRVPLQAVDSNKSFDPGIMSNSSKLWPGIIHLFRVLADTDSNGLREESWDDSLTAFEEFANGGLEVLEQEFGGEPGKLESMMGFLLTSEARTPTNLRSIQL